MKTLEQKISVMQAALDGKDIEAVHINTDNKWITIIVSADKINWCWAEMDYRIKQEPMEFWVNVYDSHNNLHNSEDAANNNANPSAIIKTIKVREVAE